MNCYKALSWSAIMLLAIGMQNVHAACEQEIPISCIRHNDCGYTGQLCVGFYIQNVTTGKQLVDYTIGNQIPITRVLGPNESIMMGTGGSCSQDPGWKVTSCKPIQ